MEYSTFEQLSVYFCMLSRLMELHGVKKVDARIFN